MAIPHDIDSEAVELFREADWPWDDSANAFVEARQPDRESTAVYRARSRRSIGYETLRDRGLAGAPRAANRNESLNWFRSSLGLDD